MTETKVTIQEFLADLSPFNRLSTAARARLSQQVQPLRYRMGQVILKKEILPAQIIIIYQGQARFLAYDPRTQAPITLKLLKSGEVIGWVGLVRGVACETAIASVESICLTLPAAEFLALLEQEPELAKYVRSQCSLIEVFDLLGAELARRADGSANLKELALKALPNATVCHLSTGKNSARQLDFQRMWFVSSGAIANFPVGSYLNSTEISQLTGEISEDVRLVGLADLDLPTVGITAVNLAENSSSTLSEIPYASEIELYPIAVENSAKSRRYPYIYGKGSVTATLACFQMLSQHLEVPWRRDMLQKVLSNQLERTGSISLQFCGAVVELMGLQAQLVNIPPISVGRLPAPAIISTQDSFAVIYEISEKEIVVAVPEAGIRRWKTVDFVEEYCLQQDSVQILLLKPSTNKIKEGFSLRWFLPSLYRYRRVLIEVLIASFFVQLFGLANPLMTQVIIDKVILNNSLDTLEILGIFLIGIAIFEAILTSLRTYLFVDTTNRIDLALGSEIIDHLLRLPLRYFEKRPVGELASRINELETIRQFLTGTALTVVLDAVFSILYIAVMVFYSPLLTAVALGAVPLFILLTVVFSPIVRRRLRTKAESYAKTQSYLIEVLSGISTVKAQNIELRSRWQWQDLYSRYVSSGFQAVLISTAAGSTSNFLNTLSGLLVLWMGAYLVIHGELTLGALIAFRIIAGYVTSPLLRLAQLWQNFQQTALSLERLGDILDAPQEADENDRTNIPMPTIQGTVKYENISFRFAQTGAPQLSNISVEFPPGTFVGIVGQSGSGKSTLTKLLPRLYEPNAGRILVDDYDVSKVELYSLRRQIGIVPQDSLLFDGTVQENIALTHPDAAAEEIIEAAKTAVAHEFIMSLPNGYNTRVGERGSTLSGGQRQRIAIARTILQNPRLLILDEATSALDYDSERQVCLNLAVAFKGKTVFFITHRLSTIKNADVIVMMAQGSIVEQGTHAELMELKGRYYCLYRQQEAQI